MIYWLEITGRLALASLFGAAIGLERERKDWAAGLRTHMMVCVGSALIMLVSTYGFSDILGTKNVVLDPSRIAAQVISGIGFIGAGTILFLRQGIIRGLTTASGLWTVAAIGLATGAGMYFAAFITTLLALIILWILQPLEKRVSSRFKQKSLKFTVPDRSTSAGIINTILQSSADIATCSIDYSEEGCVISFRFNNLNTTELMGILRQLESNKGIREINWSR
jgi:putative Mg2+ transporter-C (MgtC) family protein